MLKRGTLLTLPHLRFHVNLGLCNLSRLSMRRPEPFDICDNLAPHVSFFMCVRGFLFCQPISRTIASRHVGEMDERFRKESDDLRLEQSTRYHSSHYSMT